MVCCDVLANYSLVCDIPSRCVRQEKLRILETDVEHHKSAAKRLRAAVNIESAQRQQELQQSSPVATRSYVERLAAQQEQVPELRSPSLSQMCLRVFAAA